MHGMGELHLEIITERLRTEYKLNPSIGQMRVAYRETIQKTNHQITEYDTLIGTGRQFATVGLQVEPLEASSEDPHELNQVEWKPIEEGAKVPRPFVASIVDSVTNALDHGPIAGHKLAYIKVIIDEASCRWDSDSSIAAFNMCANMALKNVRRP